MTAGGTTPGIDALVEDLQPVRPPGSEIGSLAGWLLVSWVSVVALVLAAGSLRSGALAQLASSPRFLVECLLGASVGGIAMTSALRLATPGRMPLWRAALYACLSAGIWAAVVASGLLESGAVGSMTDKRPHCSLETLLYALPPLVLGVLLLRRRAPLARAWTAALAGLAAASIPALVMQLACIYEPLHGLAFHLLPALLLAFATAALSRRLLRAI